MTNKPEPNTRAGEALKPCPFCQGEAEWRDDPGTCDVPFGLVVNHAKGCFLQLPHQDCDGIVERWNTRPLPQPSELVAEVKRLTTLADDHFRNARRLSEVVVARDAQIAKLQAVGDKLAGAAQRLIPPNANLQNNKWPDDTNIPLDVPLGELRGLTQALAEWKDRA